MHMTVIHLCYLNLTLSVHQVNNKTFSQKQDTLSKHRQLTKEILDRNLSMTQPLSDISIGALQKDS